MKQKVSFVFHWTKGLQRKAEFFCIRYFWRTKRKSTETFTERCFSCQNKSVCQKLARSCKKWKSANIWYTPFLHEGLQLSLRAVLREESEMKLLLRNRLTAFSMTLEGNEFLLNVLARLFMPRWKQTQAVLLLNVMRSDKSILFGIKQSKDDVDISMVNSIPEF